MITTRDTIIINKPHRTQIIINTTRSINLKIINLNHKTDLTVLSSGLNSLTQHKNNNKNITGIKITHKFKQI